jgi:DNA-binding protein HU-beta
VGCSSFVDAKLSGAMVRLAREFNGKEAELIKLDIINYVVNQTGLARNKAEKAVETVFEGIKEALTRGERIEFRGFGIFEVRPRKTGIGRNPRSGIAMPIMPGRSIRFRPGKRLRDLE